MLEMRPNCECCNCELPATSAEARICSFECTFCVACTTARLNGRCPNCGGELLPRPRRAVEKLQKFPASTQRIFNPDGCPSSSEPR